MLNAHQAAVLETAGRRAGISCFPEMLEFIREQYADRTAFSYTRNGEQRQVTYAAFCEDVHDAALRLPRAGVPVGLLGENRYEWIVSYFAVVLSGNIAIPLDSSANPETLRYELENAGCSNIIHTERYSALVREMQVSYAMHLSAFSMEDMAAGGGSAVHLYSPGSPEEKDRIRTLFKGASVAIYTSGTTSKPKGVLLSQEGIILDAVAATRLLQFHATLLLFLPLYHVLGFTGGVLIPMLEGCTVILASENRNILQNIRLSGAECTLAVPAMLRMFRDAVRDAGNDLSLLGNVRQIISGGAALAPELFDFFEENGIAIQIGYGLSESSCAVSVNGNGARHRNTVGLPLDCCRVKIKDPDANGCGEILVAGRNIMLGYLNAPDLTEKAFDGEYFRSGDIGYLDEDGHICITGRCKNLIVMSNGKKVAPEELESCIGMIPRVKEVIVFLTGGGAEKEAIAAEIYADPKADPDICRQQILEAIDSLNRNLPFYKRVQKVYFRDSEFEKTSTRKIVRKPSAVSACPAEQPAGGELQSILSRVAEIIGRLTDVSPETVAPDSELFNDLGLDSLYYASLMCELCDMYGITIPEEKYRSIRTVRDITSAIQAEKATA